MKVLIASDLHGSYFYAKKIVEIFNNEKADKLVLLGDIYNHGPRNNLPEKYSPMQVAEVLNGVKEKLIVVKGNCDSTVDTMISEFDFVENACLIVENKTVFLTHGHVNNKNAMPKTNYDAIIYGHFHTCFIEKVGQTTVANAGSLSLPKNGTPNSYILLEDTTLTLKDIDGKQLDTVKL